MNAKIIYVLIFSLSTLSACATKPNSGTPTQVKVKEINYTTNPVKPKQDSTVELLIFSESYSNLTVESQKAAFTETNQALAENRNDLTQRIKLAIMLSTPASRVRDINKAQTLLLDLLQENNLSTSESALISLLYEYVMDNSKLTQKNRDDAKKLEATQTKYENLQQKYDALEQKLNDLKNIEKTMNDRDAKPVSKP